MEYMESIESNSECQETKGETPSPKLKKSFNILSDKNNNFLISLESKKDLLTIIACDNKFIKNYYKEKFSLQYLRNYFGLNYDIEKCSSEILSIASDKKGIIRELNSVIELKIPLNSKKHLEITFLLKKIEKSNSEKIEQLYGLINDLYEEKEKQKKETDELRKELEDFTHQEIHIIGLDGKEYGSSMEINFFGKNKFKEYMDIDLIEHGIYMKVLLKYDVNKKDNLKKIIEKKNKENKDFNMSIKNEYVSLNFGPSEEEKKSKEEDNKIIEMMKNFFNAKELLKMNINFCTELLVKDILKKKSTKEIIEKFFQMKLIIKGVSINIKLLIISILSELEKENKIKFLEDSCLSKIFTIFKFALNNKITYLCLNKNHVNEIINLKETENIIKSAQLELKSSNIVDKELVVDFINFEDIIVFFIFPKMDIGFKIKLMLNSFNEVVNQVFEDGEEEKEEEKEEEEREDEKKIEIKELVLIKKEKDKKIDDNEMKKLKKFREEFNLDEKEFSNELLIEVLRKNKYDIVLSFSSLFK